MDSEEPAAKSAEGAGEVDRASGETNPTSGEVRPTSGETNWSPGEVSPTSGEANRSPGEVSPTSGETNRSPGEVSPTSIKAEWGSFGVAVAGGVVFALTAPPTNFYPCVFLGLAALAVAIADAKTAWRAFGRGAAWGTAAGIVGLRFVPAVILRFTPLGHVAAYLALVLLAAAQSLIWAIGAAAFSIVRRRLKAPFELAFAACVFVATSLPTVFAWTPAGLVSPWPSLVQLADVIGERGVSALFAIACALFARAALASAKDRRWVWKPALSGAALLGALAIYGAARIPTVERAGEEVRHAKIGLVDQAVGPEDRWQPRNWPSILATLKHLTRKSEAEGATLTVWPEAAYPYAIEHDATSIPRGPKSPIDRALRGPILMGLITRDLPTTVGDVVERNSFNSATIVDREGNVEPPYDKLQLLWFGEMVPGGQYFPWLRHIFQKSGGLIPGTAPRALTIAPNTTSRAEPPLTIEVLNCYEDTLTDVAVKEARALHPNLLVNVTNDAWFFGTAEPELHARLATMRAIELRKDLVRAVNMGVATWVDAAGVVRARYADEAPSVLMTAPAVRDDALTFYARAGDAPFALALAVAIALFFFRDRRKATSRADP